ncbi:hypothetical protein Tco_0509557 [Tanacetum coccineum]
MSRRLAGKKMTPGASTSVSPNVARKKKRQSYRMLYDILEDPAAALPGASSPREMNITDGTRRDDEVYMFARVLYDMASGNSEAGASSGIVPEDRALAETVGRSSDTYITNNVANGSGQSSRPKRNGKKPIWMKDYMGDAEEESE